ncbi:MAG: hypothetical protein JNM36_16425 [Chitinophagales bacterium]|mgnify:CR=1 FL=1|jgi:hypothetical protein|nr:hypothetical protein [Chitinophagales bacterium]HNI43175.1 hypothetical protein [Chitinophagales bacterium]HNL06713.1 hypothetical protein [Chitinophagales bacterium]
MKKLFFLLSIVSVGFIAQPVLAQKATEGKEQINAEPKKGKNTKNSEVEKVKKESTVKEYKDADKKKMSVEEKTERRLDEFTKVVGLSKDQRAKAEGIVKQYYATMDEVQTKIAGDKTGEYSKRASEAQKKMQADFRAMLTPDQLGKYDAYVAKIKDKKKKK